MDKVKKNVRFGIPLVRVASEDMDIIFRRSQFPVMSEVLDELETIATGYF